jgi:predicted dehydrogenase
MSVRWICDIREDKFNSLHKQYSTARLTRQAADVFRDTKTDAVVIATPLAAHYELARQALLAGKHVFVEKPFVPASREARLLADLAEKKKKVLMVGFTYVYNPAVRKIKALIDSGKLGQVYYLNSTRVNLGIFRDRESVIWDLASHDFSIMNYWFKGPVRSIVCTGQDSFRRGRADTAMISVEFVKGIMAYLLVSWHSPIKMRNMILAGSRKMLFFNDERCAEKIKIFDRDKSSSKNVSAEYQPVANCNSVFSPWVGGEDALNAEVDHFFRCVKTGKRPETDGEMGVKVVRSLEAAERSLRLGRKVLVARGI